MVRTLLIQFMMVVGAHAAFGETDHNYIAKAAAVWGCVVLSTADHANPVAVRSGARIKQQDVLSTGRESRVQVAFLDQSALLMGSNAEIRVDEFAYSPQSNYSAVETIRVVRGAFRLVTGAVARNAADGVQLKMPSATLIVREAIVAGICALGSCDVRLEGSGGKYSLGKMAGSVVILSRNGTSSVLTQPGQAVHIEPDGTFSLLPTSGQAEFDNFLDMFSPEASRGPHPLRGGASAAIASDSVSLSRLSYQAIIEAINEIGERVGLIDSLDQVLRQMSLENGHGVPEGIRGSN